MPFLDEQELASLQREIHDANVTKDELESELKSQKEELSKAKSKSRGINIFFAILAGAAIALSFFLYSNKASFGLSSSKIEDFKKQESARLLDSIVNAQDYESHQNTNSIEDDTSNISSAINEKTIYSVQIGVFSKKKKPLLSQTIAGTTSQEDLFKYSVGIFNTLQEAQDFRKELVKIGFRDAFVASYINGERQQIHNPN